MKIEIPFRNQFKTPMLKGYKTVTSRTKQYGSIGDTFEAFGTIFMIEQVQQCRLDQVAEFLYHAEGFDTPDDFKTCWAKIHPIKGFSPSQIVWAHRFRMIERY